MTRALSISVAVVMMLCGCSTDGTDPAHVENDFGNSVRQMISSQIYDKNSPMNTEPNNGMDGVHGEAVLKKQRETVGNPADVDQQIQIKASP